MWKENARQTFVFVASIVASITVLLLLYQVYAMVLPTLIVTTLMIVPYFSRSENRFITYIATRPLSWWIMTWFVTIVTVLTVIGTLFRGPGWSWTWPWQKIY
jgi:hypothetical protein